MRSDTPLSPRRSRWSSPPHRPPPVFSHAGNEGPAQEPAPGSAPNFRCATVAPRHGGLQGRDGSPPFGGRPPPWTFPNRPAPATVVREIVQAGCSISPSPSCRCQGQGSARGSPGWIQMAGSSAASPWLGTGSVSTIATGATHGFPLSTGLSSSDASRQVNSDMAQGRTCGKLFLKGCMVGILDLSWTRACLDRRSAGSAGRRATDLHPQTTPKGSLRQARP